MAARVSAVDGQSSALDDEPRGEGPRRRMLPGPQPGSMNTRLHEQASDQGLQPDVEDPPYARR